MKFPNAHFHAIYHAADKLVAITSPEAAKKLEKQ